MKCAHRFRYPALDGKKRIRGVCRCGKKRRALTAFEGTKKLFNRGNLKAKA